MGKGTFTFVAVIVAAGVITFALTDHSPARTPTSTSVEADLTIPAEYQAAPGYAFVNPGGKVTITSSTGDDIHGDLYRETHLTATVTRVDESRSPPRLRMSFTDAAGNAVICATSNDYTGWSSGTEPVPRTLACNRFVGPANLPDGAVVTLTGSRSYAG